MSSTLDLTVLDQKALDEALEAVQAREREVKREMAPLESRLAEIRAELQLLRTEQSRRQRMSQVEHRRWIRGNVKGGEFPCLEEVLATGNGISPGAELAAHSCFLSTGGEVALGFPGAQPSVAFTDGQRNLSARSFDEARRLYAEGLELGTNVKLGVRVHFVGTRQERLVSPEEVFVGPAK